jgi:hypothetical protein
MKTKLIVVFSLAIILLSSIVFISCGDFVSGSGKIDKKKFDFTDFTQINIDNNFDVNIIQSNDYSITITADDNIIQDYLNITLSDDGKRLSIGLKSGYTYNIPEMILKADIKMKTLIKLFIKGDSHCHLINKGFEQTKTLDVNIDNSSSLIGMMKTSNNLNLKIDGTSKVSLMGSASKMNIDINGLNGSTIINLGNFEVKEAEIKSTGIGKSILNVRESIKGSLKGASSLIYYGNPSIEINKSGGATVKKAE